MLPSDTQIAAGNSPLATMWENAASFAKSKLRKQMRQLMPQCSIDFSRAELLQSGIERNEATPEIGPTYRGAHSPIPLDPQSCCQFFRAERAQKRGGDILQVPRRWKQKNCRCVETELQLPKRGLFSRCVSHSCAAQSLKQCQPSLKFLLLSYICRQKNG